MVGQPSFATSSGEPEKAFSKIVVLENTPAEVAPSIEEIFASAP
jgi:hypothetical protein